MRKNIFLYLFLLILSVCCFVESVFSQPVKIDNVFTGSAFPTTSTVYIGNLVDVGKLDSMLFVVENYDSLTATIQMISYTPQMLPIDTLSLVNIYTTATVSAVKLSAVLTPMIKRNYCKIFVTAYRRNLQTSNDTKINVWLYRFGRKPEY